MNNKKKICRDSAYVAPKALAFLNTSSACCGYGNSLLLSIGSRANLVVGTEIRQNRCSFIINHCSRRSFSGVIDRNQPQVVSGYHSSNPPSGQSFRSDGVESFCCREHVMDIGLVLYTQPYFFFIKLPAIALNLLVCDFKYQNHHICTSNLAKPTTIEKKKTCPS